MSYGLVGLYAVYLIFVGVHGNASPLFQAIQKDLKGYAPWVLAILVLKALYQVDSLRPAIRPFIFLAALTFILRNYTKVSGQINEITGLSLPK